MKKLIAIYTLAIALGACSEDIHSNQTQVESPPAPDPHAPVITDYSEIYVNGSRYDIFKLPDGTECVSSYQHETITCNWQKPETEVTQ